MTSRSDVIPESSGIQSAVIIPAQAGIQFVEILGGRLEFLDLPAAIPGRPALLLLHEGLGCVSMWRDFPRALPGCGHAPHRERPDAVLQAVIGFLGAV